MGLKSLEIVGLKTIENYGVLKLLEITGV